MDDTTAEPSGTSKGSKRANEWEARLIPGINGVTTFGFPDKIITKLRYCDAFEITTGTSGTIGAYVFSANSIFDPDVTGVGHQPMWRDEWTQVYNHYKVLGSTITVRFSASQAGDGFGPWVCGLTGDDSGTLATTTRSTAMEMNNGKWGVLGARYGGDSVLTIDGFYSPDKNLGTVADVDSMGAVMGASPANQFYYILWASDIQNNVLASDICVAIEIDYTVQLDELNSIPGS